MRHARCSATHQRTTSPRTVTGGRPAPCWHHRVNIASALAYLQAHDLRSSNILLDANYATKITGAKLVSSTPLATNHHYTLLPWIGAGNLVES
jgi:hypothetical protein